MTTCALCGHVTATVLRSWEAWIDAKVESANVTRSNHGAAHHAYKKKRDAWMIRWQFAFAGKFATIDKKRRHVTFTRHYTGREREFDHANLVAGMKGPVDAMVRVGLLVDDSPKWFEATYLQVRSDRSGLHVRIEERE